LTIKKFRVSFEFALDSKDFYRGNFKALANEERLKADLEGILKDCSTLSIESLEVKEMTHS